MIGKCRGPFPQAFAYVLGFAHHAVTRKGDSSGPPPRCYKRTETEKKKEKGKKEVEGVEKEKENEESKS